MNIVLKQSRYDREMAPVLAYCRRCGDEIYSDWVLDCCHGRCARCAALMAEQEKQELEEAEGAEKSYE